MSLLIQAINTVQSDRQVQVTTVDALTRQHFPSLFIRQVPFNAFGYGHTLDTT
jgi:hypothetical protein